MSYKEGRMDAEMALDLATQYLNSILSDEKSSGRIPDDLDGHRGLAELATRMKQVREFTLAISQGDLGHALEAKGQVPEALNELQSQLRHLTWQAEVVASGDYSQRADFMGQFSRAFNSMIEQLESMYRSIREGEDRYRRMAITDSLTNLFNRRHFYNLAEIEVSRSRRHAHHLGLMLLVLDNFKELVDDLGQGDTDRILANVGDVLKHTVRPMDVSARFGGEEFIILLPETDQEGALNVAERIRSQIAHQEHRVQKGVISITSTVGVNVLQAGTRIHDSILEELDGLIRGADKALQVARGKGPDQVECTW